LLRQEEFQGESRLVMLKRLLWSLQQEELREALESLPILPGVSLGDPWELRPLWRDVPVPAV
jgi:hypothetical protein